MAEHEKGNKPACERNSSSEKYCQYEEVIQRKLHPIFESFINPHNVLKVFWKYDRAVLVRRDIQQVEAVANNNGMAAGAGKLLELLPLYKNWLPCLMQVLRDNEVKQEHVAEMILHAIEGVKSDTEVDITVKALAEKEVLLDRLKTELEQERTRHAAKEKEMLEQKVLAEKNQQDQDLLIQRLKIELEETKNSLKREVERCAAEEAKTLEQKVLAEKHNQDQDILIQNLKTEFEKEMLEQKVLAEKSKQDQDILFQKLKTDFETLVNWLLRDTTKFSMMKSLMLHFAACNQFHAVKELIKRGADINTTDINEKTVLMFAARAGNLEYVSWLLDHGADINMADRTGDIALSHAAATGNSDCVQALLKSASHKHINLQNKNGQTPLMLTAESTGDNVLCLKKLLNSGSDVSLRDTFGSTALAYAARGGNVECVQILLESDNHEHINLQNNNGQTPLMLAAESKGDNVLCLKELVNSAYDVNLRDNEDYTALAYAAKGGNIECIQTLLEAGSQINFKNKNGQTPLMLAARSKGDNVLCLHKLLNVGAVDVEDNEGYTALAYAAQSGNTECVHTLLEAGSHKHINTLNTDNQTPLILAARNDEDNNECLQQLLNAGADIDVRDKYGYTALAAAAERGNTKCVQTLLKVGGSKHINIPEQYGQTPLILAARCKGDNSQCLQTLLTAGASIDIKDTFGYTALACTAKNKNINCVQILLEAGSLEHIDFQNNNGQTPLMLAAKSKGDNVLCLERLLTSGSDVTLRDGFGYTVLDYAAMRGNVECVQTLLQAGSQKHINLQYKNGQTPLMLAAGSKGDNVLCLKKLLNSGSDVNIRDKWGYTALAYAVECGNVNSVQILLEAGGNKDINLRSNSGQTPLILAAGSIGDNVLCMKKLLNVGADIDLEDNDGYTALTHAVKCGNAECVKILLKAHSKRSVKHDLAEEGKNTKDRTRWRSMIFQGNEETPRTTQDGEA